VHPLRIADAPARAAPDPRAELFNRGLEKPVTLPPITTKPTTQRIFAVGSIGEVDEECNSLDDPYRLKNWLMVRDIRRRLVEGT
jgi:hypothetical protein